jgi:hypothetical protein
VSISVDFTNTNNLQKAYSTDVNDAGTLLGRTIAQLVRSLVGDQTFLGYQPTSEGSYALTVSATRTKVWGLPIELIDDSPREITIGAGLVVTNDGAETPDTLDSTYRAGLRIESGVLAIPTSDDNWHLLQAEVVNEDVSANRDILTNPNDDDFTNTSVVVEKLKRLSLTWKTGTTTAIPAPDAGCVALYGMILPTAGAAVPDIAKVVDLRTPPMASTSPRTAVPTGGLSRGITTVLSRRLATTATVMSPASQLVAFDFAAQLDGLELHAQTVDGAGAAVADWIDGGGSPAASTWYYIYLAPKPATFGGGTACNCQYAAQLESVAANCLIVLSTVNPGVDGRNTGNLALPIPFSGNVASARTAVCVGAIRQNAGGNGWHPMMVGSGGRARVAGITYSNTALPSTVSTRSAIITTTAGLLPVNVAKSALCQFGMGIKVNTQTSDGFDGRIMFTPCRTDLTQADGELSYGTVTIFPVFDQGFLEMEVPIETDDLVGGGQLTIKVETRDNFGSTDAFALLNYFFSDVLDVGSQIDIRIVGFQM